ncbi:helix-turn-helix transcriptional regulator [Specibacter sp. NPDC057265]|uniref:helix-turn-helix transcriptional regulator n=1 Tax=Specibacter sp. NPDC057265 TaxID=3346075 RepID=UPI0036384E39
MSTKIDSTERLLNLVIALLGTRRGYSKSHIRGHVNGYLAPAAGGKDEEKALQSFNRMFERDKKTLLELGIPIISYGISGSGDEDQALYRIDPEDYQVPEVRLDESAMALVAVAANLWAEATLGEAAQSALRKIAARSGTGWYEDDSTVQSRIRTVEPAFEPLWTALRNHQVVTFGYRGAGAAASAERTIEPWGLGNKYGQWYLVGRDVDKDRRRSFRLSRITSEVEVHGKGGFAPPAAFNISSLLSELGTGEAAEADIAVPVNSAHELRSRPGTRLLTPEQCAAAPWGALWPPRPGWDVVRVSYREPELMADDVAALGAHAHLLSPPALRSEVVRRLRAAAAAAGTPVDATELSWAKAVQAAPKRKRDSRDRLIRLLSMVPYLVANPGVEEAQVLAEFGITAAEWARDRDTLNVTGLPGYYHGDLMDVITESGQVFIRDAETLASPLRLTREEACTVLVGLRALWAVVDPGREAALVQATEQVAAVAGQDAWLSDAVGIHLVSGMEIDTITALQEAINSKRACVIRYLVASRDEVGERTVEPRRLFSVDSAWFLRAWCRRAGGLRSFRVDRIQSLQDVGPQAAAVPEGSQGDPLAGVYHPGSNDTELCLLAEQRTAERLAPAYNARLFAVRTKDPAAWGATPQGWVGMRFLVGDPATVPALMARLGGSACVVAPPQVRFDTAGWLERAARSYDGAHAVGETADAAPGRGR